MASDIDIWNLALTKLGAQPIPSATSNDPKAALFQRTYTLYRDELQTIFRWNFTLTQAELAVLNTAPMFGYNYAYQLPADCLRLQQGDVSMGVTVDIGMPGASLGDYNTQRNQDYRIYGRQVYTNVPAPFRIEYAARVTDPTLFDFAFVNALASYLAFNLCEQITGSSAKKQAAEQMYDRAIHMARMNNAIQLPPETIPDDTFIESRLSS